jgi:hypothetical protein
MTPIVKVPVPLLAPVVVIKIFAVDGLEAETLTVGGDDVHVAPVGKPAHVIVTVPLKPDVPCSVTGTVTL